MKIVVITSLLLSIVPTFTTYHLIRNVGDLGPVVTDIESHLSAGHSYRDSDKITWVHEGTHGINADLRNRFGRPGFYVLENKAILLKEEPRTTLTHVARRVPVSLRGDVYNLYLLQSRRWWENEPSYIFDEWVAYTNGSEARISLCIQARQETVRYMLELSVYSTCVPWAAKSDDPQTRSFIMWQIKRSMKLYKASGIRSAYLDRLRNAADATELRLYMRDYFGREFTRKVLSF